MGLDTSHIFQQLATCKHCWGWCDSCSSWLCWRRDNVSFLLTLKEKQKSWRPVFITPRAYHTRWRPHLFPPSIHVYLACMGALLFSFVSTDDEDGTDRMGTEYISAWLPLRWSHCILPRCLCDDLSTVVCGVLVVSCAVWRVVAATHIQPPSTIAMVHTKTSHLVLSHIYAHPHQVKFDR